jgi:hypothetical protein
LSFFERSRAPGLLAHRVCPFLKSIHRPSQDFSDRAA